MSGIFPLRQTVTADRGEPRLVDFDDETADKVFEALSAETTRQIFVELHETPQAASDLARVTDTSVQNVQYHLEKLTDADLVEVVDTWYSERGTEMKVYAPSDESLVLFAGSDKGRSLRSLLKRVVGVVGVLLPASALVGWAAKQFGSTNTAGGTGAEVAGNTTDYVTTATEAGNEAGAMEVTGTTPTPAPDPSKTPGPDAVQGGVDAVAGVLADPGVAAGLSFFLGGVFVVTLVLAVFYTRS